MGRMGHMDATPLISAMVVLLSKYDNMVSI